jgi:hypothetical protein
MPPEDDVLFFRLSKSGRELVPVNYRMLVSRETGRDNSTSLAESAVYRSKGYACHLFYKPISKNFKL